ncbi:MAG: PDZ domain-containing protein [Tannerellaceae bacterium]|jgi:tricorn protease|nr:PDZ domain-containing protein [Tannerellaceae bacterium]
MYKIIIHILWLWAVAFCSLHAAEEARLLRFPATNGEDIVFVYAGDLYKAPINGGEASRLTSHVGYEMFPRFSPDGKTIAFTAQYDGNTEVYAIPSTGGEPLRLTYTATNQRDDLGDRMGPNNIVMTWTPDGSRIVYRNRIGSGFEGRLRTVGPAGGLSESIPLPEGGFCSYSPDGRRMAYNRVMREFRTWKYYKGGMADDIWIYDPDAKTVENITRNDVQDIIPMWAGDNIFFLSDRDRTMNIFVYNTSTKQTAKVTDFSLYDVKFPSIHGGTIVFENGGYLYRMDVATRTPQKISITLASDNIYARSEVKDAARYLTAASLSPGGERLAVTARGEVFDLPALKGVARNITRTPGAHEREAQWSPDGRYIAYISDVTGETELFVRDALAATPPRQLTTKNDTYIRSFRWSPDAASIVYTDRENRIILLDLSSAARTTILKDTLSEVRSVNFSPDSKWLTYSRLGVNSMWVVYVYHIATKKEYPVTDKWYDSLSPVFSADGKYLVFTSARDFEPIYGSLEWNHVYDDMNGVYLALLSAATPSPFLTEDPGPTAAKAVEKKDSLSAVTFDPAGITDRIIKLPLKAGSYRGFYAQGDKVYYTINGDTRVYDLKKQKEEDVVQGASMSVEPGRRKALFRKGRTLYVADIPTGKVELKDEVSLANLHITTDYPQEWAQIFGEAWRAMRDGFYVENMHGTDWQAMKRKYEVLLPYVKNRLDLNYVIGEMIGELNCGHAYITPGELSRAGRIPTGLLGAEVSRHPATGYFRIDRILPGVSWSDRLRSPLTQPGAEAKEGEYILSVDGIPANSVNDLYALLTGKAGTPTELLLSARPEVTAQARRIVITPIEEEYSLYHYNWIQENIRKVDKASGGKIGYIYIPDMSVEGLNEFARYFYPQLDKEGLIIDDRSNGGGNVSPMILERLAREPYRLTMSRGSARIGRIPDAVQVGPKVCLIDKYSASDGDLFPWGFRALGLGKLIGTRTWGGIVGISSSLPFIDGTDLRVPFFTSYDPRTGEWIIENHGVDPDILIDNDPIRQWNGEDQQLDRAIQEVMNDLKDRRPLPPVPSPRVWNQ